MQALPKGDNFMLISSKGRYTLYVLVDLAKNGQNRYIPLKEIAERQNIKDWIVNVNNEVRNYSYNNITV